MENKVKKLIKKLEAENADRYDDLKYSDIDKDRRRRMNHKHNFRKSYRSHKMVSIFLLKKAC